ncbi:MAG: arsenate reductase ArsC [Longimicrobiales bacterium]|nr:arsenate reductase ArsC [Longimicrobiales bacterium]
MNEVVEVRLATGHDSVGHGSQLEEIGEIAVRLGVDLVMKETEAHQGVDSGFVGDVEISPDAPAWLLEAAFLRALAPSHILFLCVANSARSQLAEGLARSLAPAGVRISSAGSAPTALRPQAIEALAEIGLDISSHRSIGIDEVELPVEAVITLCAEEVCPVWLEPVSRLHWRLPDPAAAVGSAADDIEAFREVRDELSKRLRVLFKGPLT